MSKKLRKAQQRISEKRQLIAEQFIDEHKEQILLIAKHYFPSHFNILEILSEATEACFTALTQKRAQYKIPKGENVFIWYIKKQFAEIHKKKFAGTIDADTRFASSSAASHIEQHELLMGSLTCLDDSSELVEDDLSADFVNYTSFINPGQHVVPAYHVAVDTFISDKVPKRLTDALRILSAPSGLSIDVSVLLDSYGCKSLPSLKHAVRRDLKTIQKLGIKLYKGKCLNGSYSAVVLCAKTPSDARSALQKYGDVLECNAFSIMN